jgi:hypothetical protein
VAKDSFVRGTTGNIGSRLRKYSYLSNLELQEGYCGLDEAIQSVGGGAREGLVGRPCRNG